MKKLLLFVFALVAFAACEQAPIEEQSAIRQETPETITVGFEGDDTRIQLNSVQKTVWTKDDLVSVFYFSDANQKWQFQGQTGDRVGNLKRVNADEPTAKTTFNVVAYPYNEEYFLNTRTGALHATLPATQHYLKDSYGVGDNLMVAQSEFTQFSLKSVCGWLKLQLTGDGEVVKSITFKGNDGEQVAGLVHVDTATAEATLASEMGSTEDNNAGGNLVFEDTILSEVTLDCGAGVALGKNVTAFYIALPPQTFDDGFTVEVACVDGSKMVKSSNKALSIERNHIQPMAEFSYTANISPSNVIWYTTSDGGIVSPKNDAFGVNILSNTYADGKGVITFDGDVTEIGREAFSWNRTLTSITIPNTVKTIGVGAFYECSNLTNIIIPNSVTTIEHEAFKYSAITKLTIGKNVTRVDARAFAHCINLTNLTVTNGTTVFGRDAFEGCIGLTRVAIPNGITMSDNNIFVGCKNIEQFKGKQVIDNGRLIVLDNLLMSFAPSGLTSYTIPDSITVIGEAAFIQVSDLEEVTISNNIISINDRAFRETGLTYVEIPASVKEIGVYSFSGCEYLEIVKFNEGLEVIKRSAFAACPKLTHAILPDTLTTIDQYGFQNCHSLKQVYIPISVTYIGEGTFYFVGKANLYIGVAFRGSL